MVLESSNTVVSALGSATSPQQRSMAYANVALPIASRCSILCKADLIMAFLARRRDGTLTKGRMSGSLLALLLERIEPLASSSNSGGR
jgi:hypothetical protein